MTTRSRNRAHSLPARLLLCCGVSFALFGGASLRAQAPAAAEAKSAPEAILQYRSAVKLQNQGVYDLASEEWEKFLKDFPQDPLAPRARYYGGVCYLQQKEYDKAAKAMERVIAEAPAFDKSEELYLNLGITYLNAARKQPAETQAAGFEKAAATFETLLKKYPQGGKTADALYNRADALYLAGNKAAAVPVWQELVAKQPQSPLVPDALYNIGVADQELGKPADAGKAYDEFLKAFPKDKHAAEVTLRKGMTLYEQKQFAEAEKRFAAAAAFKEFSQADYALLRQGDALLELKKPNEAAAAYGKLVNEYPKSTYAGDAMLQTGKALAIAENIPEARKWFVALTADPTRSQAGEAAHWIARGYLKEGKPAEALKTVDGMLKDIKDPARVAELKLDRAESLYAMPEKKADALSAYAELANAAPDGAQAPVALYMAGQCALELGDYKQSAKFADSYLAKFPKHELAPYVRFVAAESALLGDDAPKAEAEFKTLLEQYPDHPEALTWRLRRGWCYLKQKQYPQAVEHFSTLLKSLNKPEQIAEAQALLGNALLESDKPADAARAYAASLAARAIGRTAEDAMLNLARAQRAAGDNTGAKSTLIKFLKDFPQTTQADRVHFRLGEIQHASGESKAAAAEFQWVLDNTPNGPLVPDALFGLAAVATAQGDFATAEKSYDAILTKHGDVAALARRSEYGRAVALVQQKKFAAAETDLTAFLKTAQGAEASEARYLLGYAQAAEKKYPAAIATLQTLLKEDPKYANADKVYYELAWAEQSSGDKAAAAETFGKLAATYPKSPHAAESWINAGDFAYQEKKDYKASAAAYEKAIAAAPADGLLESALHMLGWSLFNQNDFAGAAKRFGEQIAKFPTGKKAADGTFMAGETLFKQDQFAAALPALETAVAADLSTPLYKELALLHAAQSAAQLKKWDQALKLAERFVKEYPAGGYVGEALYEQAWSRQNLKQLDDAFKLYEQAFSDATKAGKGELAARAKFMAGEILFEQGNHNEAVKSFYKVAYGADPKTFPTWQANSLYEAARCFEVLKNVEQAKKLYAELVTTYPESDKRKAAEQRLTALK